jgi:Flp pilus assembly protein TadD
MRVRAFENLQRAVSLDPNSVVVRTLRGLYYQRIGDERTALAEFQLAVQLSPQDPALYASLGDSYARSGDLIAALQAYQAAAALTPDEVSYWRRLAQFSAAHQVNVADVGVPAAQKTVVFSKDDASDLDLLGWLLVLSGRHPEAERQLLRALALDPQLASAHFHLGMLYLQTTEREQARAALLRARDLGYPEAQAVLNQFFP